MLLAGVVMKLGGLRVPASGDDIIPRRAGALGSEVLGFGSWRDVLALLAAVGIVYGAMVALVQKDFKFVIGYSSVSHMGFRVLALMAINSLGLSGAVLQMFSQRDHLPACSSPSSVAWFTTGPIRASWMNWADAA